VPLSISSSQASSTSSQPTFVHSAFSLLHNVSSERFLSTSFTILQHITKVFAQHDLSTSFTHVITKVFAQHDLSTTFTHVITKVFAQHKQQQPGGIGMPK